MGTHLSTDRPGLLPVITSFIVLGRSPCPQDLHIHICTFHQAETQKYTGLSLILDKGQSFFYKTTRGVLNLTVVPSWERANTRTRSLGYPWTLYRPREHHPPISLRSLSSDGQEEEAVTLVTREVMLQQDASSKNNFCVKLQTTAVSTAGIVLSELSHLQLENYSSAKCQLSSSHRRQPNYRELKRRCEVARSCSVPIRQKEGALLTHIPMLEPGAGRAAQHWVSWGQSGLPWLTTSCQTPQWLIHGTDRVA